MTIKQKKILYVAAIIIIAIILIIVSTRGDKASVDNKNDVILVRVEPAVTGPIQNTITLTGELKAVNNVDIKPKISGRLERLALDTGISITEGTQVKKGQVLAVLEHAELSAQVARAAAAVETAKATLIAAQANEKNTQREKTRMENLFSQGSATEKQRDNAVTANDLAIAEVAMSQAKIDEAQAGLQMAKVNLDEAFLKSPFDGVVSHKMADEGEMVSPTTTIVSVVPMMELKILVDVPEKYLSVISQSTTQIKIAVDAYPGQQFETRIETIYPTVQPQTRTFTLELRVKNILISDNSKTEFMLRPEMYATAVVILEEKHDSIIILASNLVRLLDKYYVFVVSDNIAHHRQVETGIWSGEFVEITKGLTAGEYVVVSGQNKLADKTPVRVISSDTGIQRGNTQ